MTDIADLLATDVPPEHVTQREGAGGMKLDYVTGRYVKQRLNEIFGWDGWSYEVIRVELFPEECTAFAHVRLKVMETPAPEYMLISSPGVTKDGLAYGHGRKGAEGFDFAIAEAVTDALKRAAVSLGQNMGLSLYPYAKGRKKDIIDEIPIIKDWANAIAEAHDMEVLKFVWEQVEASDLSASGKGGLAELKDSKKADLAR